LQPISALTSVISSAPARLGFDDADQSDARTSLSLFD
jgi:hypothetical protein